jgi:hypothetical protein
VSSQTGLGEAFLGMIVSGPWARGPSRRHVMYRVANACSHLAC